MYVRLKENQEKHDRGVAYWTNQVRLAGWSTVLFDLPGYVKPMKIADYIPDIHASHFGAEYIIEIETLDSINTQHALQQKIAFQAWANLSPNRKFEIRLV